MDVFVMLFGIGAALGLLAWVFLFLETARMNLGIDRYSYAVFLLIFPIFGGLVAMVVAMVGWVLIDLGSALASLW